MVVFGFHLPVAKLLAAAPVLLIALGSWTLGPDTSGRTASGGSETNRYIGAQQCKNCHQSKESGDQYSRWQEEKHPKAFDELASENAKKYGKARGIDDPQTSDKCLKCHVTAFGEPKENLHRSFDPKMGVQCETCHGPGEKHRKARMAAAASEEGDKKGPAYTTIPDDEIMKAPTVKVCAKCHNDESPGYKPFCFHKFVGEVRHLNPLKPRTDEQKAAMLKCGCEGTCVCKTTGKDGQCAFPPKALNEKLEHGAEKGAEKTEPKK